MFVGGECGGVFVDFIYGVRKRAVFFGVGVCFAASVAGVSWVLLTAGGSGRRAVLSEKRVKKRAFVRFRATLRGGAYNLSQKKAIYAGCVYKPMLTCYNQATTGRQNILLNIITITIILSAGRDHWVSLCRYVRFPPFPRLVIAFCRAGRVRSKARVSDHAGKVFRRFRALCLPFAARCALKSSRIGSCG